MRDTLWGLLIASICLCSCGKSRDPRSIQPKAQAPAPAAKTEEQAGPLFTLDTNEPEIPAAPDHAQAHPGPDDALKADRAGVTMGKTEQSIGLQWESAPAPDGRIKVWTKFVVVKYHLTIAIAVSSKYKEGSCPYQVTWEHELSHARAYVSMFDASKVHLLGGLEHSQEEEPPLPTGQAPASMSADEVAGFERRLGEKLRLVVEDQARVLATLMADHKKDRDSPEAYRIDTAKCPESDWSAAPGGS